jgi:hypothetical protein
VRVSNTFEIKPYYAKVLARRANWIASAAALVEFDALTGESWVGTELCSERIVELSFDYGRRHGGLLAFWFYRPTDALWPDARIGKMQQTATAAR